ncbi:MAG: DME family drug/metabolite transporter [Candidatus Poriferisodalaceae bacterium]|jgi:DME family drug/metabolite transporter
MGFVFGIASALCFAVGSILFKVGQRSRPDDDGHLIGNTLSVATFAVFAIFVSWPTYDRAGFWVLVVAGIVGTVVGRWSLLRGVRLIGPARAAPFHTATPISAAVFGWILLGEDIRPLEAVGAAFTILGLLRIVRGGTSAAGDEPIPKASYLIAAVAPASFGLAFVLRKWGLERMPGAVSGALIGSAAGVLLLVVWESAHHRLVPRLRTIPADPPWHYFTAGVVTGIALLTQFRALALVDAWVVGILGGTIAIWTPFLSVAFLKDEDRITPALLVNIGLVFAGVVTIALV